MKYMVISVALSRQVSPDQEYVALEISGYELQAIKRAVSGLSISRVASIQHMFLSTSLLILFPGIVVIASAVAVSAPTSKYAIVGSTVVS